MSIWRKPAFLVLLVGLALPLNAQSRKETLADIRQELTFLHVEIQRLNQELSTTGGTALATVPQETVLQRLDALEGELRRLTGQVEQLEFHIEKIVRDGTNRIGDLEFRLVELEGGDVSTLSETTTLGGDLATPDPVEIPTQNPAGTELAVSERGDFDAAKQAFDDGDFARSADLFAAFSEAYPGGPLSGDAHYWRGEALSETGNYSDAARSYLQSFSSAPGGALAALALFRLGVSLDRIGQRDEACLTLNEVGARYPDSDAATQAGGEMATLECSL